MKTVTGFFLTVAFVIALFLFTGCKTAPSPESSAPSTSTVELFNGRNFEGWTFCMKTNADPMQTWSVSNGVIHCTGRPLGYMRTEKIFQDYLLIVIWRFVKVAPHADNSGIFVQTQLPDKVFPECVQCQGEYLHQGDLILEGGASADGYPWAGKNITIPQMGPSNENAVGQWNTNIVVCNNTSVGLFVNGKPMNQITGCNLNSGYIGIQSEGGDIEIKKMFLEPLQ